MAAFLVSRLRNMTIYAANAFIYAIFQLASAIPIRSVATAKHFTIESPVREQLYIWFTTDYWFYQAESWFVSLSLI